MSRNAFRHILIGGGIASGHAVDTLLRSGAAGTDIALVCAEPEVPYNRPPLSKGFLLGKEKRENIFLKSPSVYTQKGVTVVQNTRAERVDANAHTVALGDGSILTYEKLLIATGCTPRRLSIPGSHLPGILLLRTLADAERLREAAANAKTAVIVGGGFIGLEVASGLSQLGLHVTVLHRGDAILDRLGVPAISAFFASVFETRGVTVRYQDEAITFEGTDHVQAVVSKRGDRLPADFVVVGIGVSPETGFLAGSGIAVEPSGIRVNEYMETSAPDVYAAGDVTLFYDPLYAKHRHIEHWDTAIQHGKIAGKNMAGTRTPYGSVSSFFSDLFEYSYDVFGDADGTDQVIQRGSFEDRAVSFFSCAGGVPRAAFTMGRPKERAKTIALIQQRAAVDTAVIADPEHPLP